MNIRIASFIQTRDLNTSAQGFIKCSYAGPKFEALQMTSSGVNNINILAQMSQCTKLDAKDAILFHQQKCAELWLCKELEITSNFYALHQGCTTQISWVARIFFLVMFKGQKLHVLPFQ
jgi:hypothetical protein